MPAQARALHADRELPHAGERRQFALFVCRHRPVGEQMMHASAQLQGVAAPVALYRFRHALR